MLTQQTIIISTPGRGMINITEQIANLVHEANIAIGLCNLFLQHTSASILICENADQAVQDDLEAFMFRLVPDGDPLFSHVEEGPDDMPSHVRTMLTETSLTVPISNGAIALGRWQGIYLWEHRSRPYERKLVVTIQS